MPQLAPIVINDGQDTPVSHTFNPNGRDANDVSSFIDRSSGVPVGYSRLWVSVREPERFGNRISPVYRIGYGVDLPVLEASSGPNEEGFTPAPQVAYTLRGKGEFLIPTRSTLTDRKNLKALYENGLTHSVMVAVLHNLEDLWS